jgi:UDP-N-acetylmuramoyl-tripeptide--D-alanyl-D-alanine ligase
MNSAEAGAHAPMLMDIAEAASAVGGKAIGSRVAFSGVSTDSRALAPGDLFVALKGEKFDGHAYLEEAAGNGAVAAMVSRRVETALPIGQVLVEDTLAALGRLAADWRNRFALPVVALTGSNGKTTVKEMLAAILAAHCGGKGAVLATRGNLNNAIGVPLTLMRLREPHRYAVIEMGMNHVGEIDALTRIATPNVALVNNAQRAHLGPMGSLDLIAQAKGEIYAGLRAGGIALVNADDRFAGYWKGLNAGRRVVTFGLTADADVHVSVDGMQLRFVTPTDAFAAQLQVAGEHNVRNACAACAAAFALDIPPRAIQLGLAGFEGVLGRLTRRAGRNGALVIDDSYNANPDSMKAALKVLALAPGRKVFVMGDMGELGEASAQLHAQVGACARAAGADALYALGSESIHAAEAFGSGGRHFGSLDALLAALEPELAPGVTLLVKGSRFMAMERVAGTIAALGGAGSGHAA